MSIKMLVQRSCELLVCGLGALYAAGCGGVAFSGDGDGNAGAGGAGAGAGGSPVGSSGSGNAGTAGSGACLTPTACPAIACGNGFVSAQSADDCCPTCVPDPDACLQDQAHYAALRQMLLQSANVHACKTDSDCTYLTGNTLCGDVCGAVTGNVTSAPSINSQLNSYAADHCLSCPRYDSFCLSSQAATCYQSVCQGQKYPG